MSDDIHHTQMMSADQDPSDNSYATPPWFWRKLARAVGGFDLDPCSGAEAQPIAPDRYTKEDNGLEQPWHGDVFVNPPWSTNGTGDAKHDWLSKARTEAQRDEVSSVVVLIPSDTGASWFHEHIVPAELICFREQRLSFVGEDRNPSFPLIIVAYGENAHKYREPLDSEGAVFTGGELYTRGQQTTLTEATHD